MIDVPFLLVKLPPSGVIVRAAGIEKSALPRLGSNADFLCIPYEPEPLN